MSNEQQKKILRQEILQLRLNLSNEEITRRSLLISKRLDTFYKDKDFHNIMAFLPFRNEVNTLDIINSVIKQNGSIILPRVEKKSHTIKVYRVQNLEHEVEVGTWGIKEPLLTLPEVDAFDIDFILVPGVAFDRQGNRLGYGGGFYDRFLNMTKALKIGICFDFQVIKNIPKETWDEKLDDILTEQGFISEGGKYHV